jgi:hypothetical protein
MLFQSLRHKALLPALILQECLEWVKSGRKVMYDEVVKYADYYSTTINAFICEVRCKVGVEVSTLR